MNPSHKNVIVLTGTSSGIGKNLAEKLIQNGYSLVEIGRTKRDDASNHIYVDLSNTEEITRVVPQSIKELGNVRALVHCAGVAHLRSIENSKSDEIIDQINVNLLSPILLTKLIFPKMAKDDGKIIFLGSRARRYAFENGASYCASKAALHSLSDVLNLESRSLGLNIGSTIFEFGPVNTEFADADLSSSKIPVEDAASLLLNFISADTKNMSLRVIEVTPSSSRVSRELT